MIRSQILVPRYSSKKQQAVSGFTFLVPAVGGLLAILFCSAAAMADSAGLESRIKPLVEAHKGQVAVAVKHLETGEACLIEADRPMPTASLIKVAVMVEAYRQAESGKLDLAALITLSEEDKVPGSGLLTTHFSPGLQISLRDAIRMMMAWSDNTATNLVLDRIGLPATAAAMEELGFPNTKIHSKVFKRETSVFPERSREFGLGSTTAGETLMLLERLYRGELASEEGTGEMLDHMRACQSTNRLPRLLPKGTKIAHKTGSVNAVRTDAGIIESPGGPLIVVVLTAENEDQQWTDQNAAEILSGRIAKEVYDYFNPSSTATLASVTDPDSFDLHLPDPLPIDPLEGTPFVTCKGWAVGDPRTGEVLWGENAEQPLPNASTTKLLTAWIALREVKGNPALWDAPVSVSKRAAETGGSTAKLRAGETLTLSDLLYGLLLPSGNDASVVVAEHFGGRFAPPDDDPETSDPLRRFVAEMNRTAAALGMNDTRFRNPHGLTAPGHQTSPRDLVRLAALLIEDGDILPYVRTRKHIGKLTATSGDVRYEIWTNTNQLLGREGYLGLKTGTTSAAGACLVSLGERDDDRLIVVVLGSTSTDARYTDTRNLYRWAWQQRRAGGAE